MAKKMIMRKLLSCLVIIAILMSAVPIFTPKVNAVIAQCNYIGRVTGIDIPSNAITIQTDYYQWYYGEGEWTPYSCTLEAKVSNEDAINEINVGDYVEASCLGSPGECGDWLVSLGKMKSSIEKVITDIYGDPAYLMSELLGDYKIEYKNKPDCSACSGCNCQAKYTDVTIIKGGSHQVDTHQLYPGQSHVYKEDTYRIDITFHSGQAYVYPECTDEPWVGPQAISNFVIHITPTSNILTLDANCVDIGDADNDGDNEIVIGRKKEIVILSYESGEWREDVIYDIGDLWPVITISTISTLTIEDADNDGNNEIILGTSATGGMVGLTNYVITLSKNQEGRWVKEEIGTVAQNIAALEVGDANNDNKNEVIVIESGLREFVISYKKVGKKWIREDIDSSFIDWPLVWDDQIKDVCIGDADADGKNEVVIATTRYGIGEGNYFKGSGTVYVYSYDGKWNREQMISYIGKGTTAVTIGDGNNDGVKRIFVGLTNGEVITYESSNAEWIDIKGKISRSYISDIVIEDYDSNALNEVLVTTKVFSSIWKTSPSYVLVYDYIDDEWSETKIAEVGKTITSAAVGNVKNIGNIIVVSMKVEPLTMVATCPVDLIVTDPDNRLINKALIEVQNATYNEVDVNEDGELDDIIIIPNPKEGEYSIEVIPEPAAAPTDIYSLQVSLGDASLFLANTVSVSDIPEKPYILKPSDVLPKKLPITSFTYTPEKTGVDQTITFDASSSYDPDGYITNYEWDFGDGSTGTGKIVTHSYSSAGNYDVTLTTTDDTGLKASVEKTITVYKSHIPVNSLVNPDFEQGLMHWNSTGGSAIYILDKIGGDYCIKGIETTKWNLGRLYQDVTEKIEAGERYKISGWLKTENVEGSVVIGLNYVLPSGWTPADGYVKEIGHVRGTTDWTYYESEWFTLPPMPEDCVAAWFLFDFNNGKGTAYWDDVSLHAEDTAEYYVENYGPLRIATTKEPAYSGDHFYTADTLQTPSNPSSGTMLKALIWPPLGKSISSPITKVRVVTYIECIDGDYNSQSLEYRLYAYNIETGEITRKIHDDTWPPTGNTPTYFPLSYGLKTYDDTIICDTKKSALGEKETLILLSICHHFGAKSRHTKYAAHFDTKDYPAYMEVFTSDGESTKYYIHDSFITPTVETIDQILKGAKLIEKVQTDSTVNLRAIIDNGDFTATIQGDYAVWEKPLTTYNIVDSEHYYTYPIEVNDYNNH